MGKKILILVGSIAFIIIGFVIIHSILNNKELFANKEGDNSTIDNINIDINTDDGDQKIIWSNYEKREISLTKSIKISEGGIYNLTGTIENGCITIDTQEDVKLVLNNVKITNSSGPAIYVMNAENVVITLEEDSNNILTDGSSYIGFDNDVNSVIYSKDDITFEGTGTLTINGNYADGIVGKDDLKIIDGTYIINTIDDAIRGKDSVYILNGNFEIKAGGDGIKSTNDTENDKGFIKIENGKFKIDADLDGIQAETKILITNGSFDVITGSGSTNSSSNVNNSNNWGNWGRPSVDDNNKVNTDSAKGIKSGDNLVIENGTFNLDTSDDAIHSNNYVGIKSGDVKISSGDDGIHADKELIIDGGKITITKSYEGLEAAKITINNGTINVVSTDDGINVAGGNDNSSINGRPGQNSFSKDTTNILTINGGNITVDSNGDGLDSNGSIYINDGTIIVYGPINSGNGALDYDIDCIVSGGTLLAGGASGMAQGIGSNSKQYGVLIGFNQTISANQKVTIEDNKGKEIISYISNKSFSSLVVSTDDLKKGSNYTIKIDGTTYSTFNVSSINNTVGNISNNGGMPGRR